MATHGRGGLRRGGLQPGIVISTTYARLNRLRKNPSSCHLEEVKPTKDLRICLIRQMPRFFASLRMTPQQRFSAACEGGLYISRPSFRRHSGERASTVSGRAHLGRSSRARRAPMTLFLQVEDRHKVPVSGGCEETILAQRRRGAKSRVEQALDFLGGLSGFVPEARDEMLLLAPGSVQGPGTLGQAVGLWPGCKSARWAFS
jgi:hypothetical protein